jgi:hypothetical protein
MYNDMLGVEGKNRIQFKSQILQFMFGGSLKSVGEEILENLEG